MVVVEERNKARILVHDSSKELVHALAERFCILAQEAIAARNSFSIALSGGSTPKDLYELLAQPEFSERIDWAHVLIFLGDERCVPPDHPDSNFGMIKKALLSKISIPDGNVFAPQGQDKDPEAAAKQYEEQIRRAFSAHTELPKFDLILLGLGPDGHTASLFPDTAALTQKERLFVANYVPQFQAHRLTLTLPVINNARHDFFLVSGDSKASIVKDIFQSQTKKYPAQFVQPENGTLEWYTDRAAAASLTGG